MSKNCEQCKKEFVSYNTNSKLQKKARFCSLECYWIFSKKNPNKGTFKKGHTLFSINDDRKKRRGSENNMWKGGQITKKCLICSVQFSVDQYRTKARTCSKECAFLYQKTEEFRLNLSEIQRSKIPEKLKEIHSTLTQFAHLLRKSARYAMWRERIHKRDNFTCQMCNVRGGKLHADHIEPFSVILVRNNIRSYEEALTCTELWNLENGRTLCRSCHYKTPTFGSKVLTLLTNCNKDYANA